MNKEDFYIGWQNSAPPGFVKHIRKVLAALLLLIASLAVILGLYQKKFDSGNFEFGKITEVKGVYSNSPVPLLKIPGEKDISGNYSTVTIPLIGFGKFGAQTVMKNLEKQAGSSLQDKEITLRGTLLYNDGKLLMQVEEKDNSNLRMTNKPIQERKQVKENSFITELKGEIVDPKCFFGVMKPGEGKVHKDCAIRCILGGIPPMLRVRDQDGNSSYYILAGKQGKPINEQLKSFIAEPVSITARVVIQDDWKILLTEPTDIHYISRRELVYSGSETISCTDYWKK
jgi:hypothetical protein